ncbi:hypothetical protein [Bacillus sp. CHD6a]|uniref:hypothetical protein n=1 Tax=Bacillus sp. CHD6a TaxID=1643452 RepID=UPI0006CCB96E|nr:hypothetical protein [Bacillus sp. CHD6a]KPB05213.1 hypothetical protein AAV98_07650 [Bacillus sp. CHD6a]
MMELKERVWEVVDSTGGHVSFKIEDNFGKLPGVEHDCGIVTYGEKTLVMAVLVDNLEDNHSGKRAIQKIGRIVDEYLRSSCSF